MRASSGGSGRSVGSTAGPGELGTHLEGGDTAGGAAATGAGAPAAAGAAGAAAAAAATAGGGVGSDPSQEPAASSPDARARPLHPCSLDWHHLLGLTSTRFQAQNNLAGTSSRKGTIVRRCLTTAEAAPQWRPPRRRSRTGAAPRRRRRACGQGLKLVPISAQLELFSPPCVTQLNPECVLELLKLSSNKNECKPLPAGAGAARGGGRGGGRGAQGLPHIAMLVELG